MSRPRAAIQHAGRTITHAELADLVGTEREAARASGLERGDRVALFCRPDPVTLVRQLALLDGGATVLPVSAALTESERALLLERCHVTWVSADGGLARTGSPNPSRGNAALGLLSSGSTGSPKLVLHTRAQLDASLDIYRQSMALSDEDSLLALAPLEHGFGFRLVHAVLAAGGSVGLPDRSQPRAVLDLAIAGRVTLLPAAPRFLDLLLGAAAGRELPHLRAAIIPATLTARAHAAFTATFAAPLWQSYGASEAGPVCLNRDGFAVGDFVALGVPNPGVAVELRDGEIVVRSPAVGLGYEGDPGGSAILDGEFWSGDLARWQDGRLVFLGRKKLLIATGGDNVDPAEVESVLRRHPGIRDAAVVGEGPGAAQLVKAILVAPDPLPFLEVTEHCARHLSPHKVPRLVEYRAALPRDALGKLRRDRL